MTFAHREGNRTQGERERDLEKISSWFIRGKTPAQIAKLLTAERRSDGGDGVKKITAEMVRHDLQKIRDGWLNSAMVDYDVAKAREVAHIDEVERAAWEGWSRSIRDQVTETSEEIDDAFGKPVGDGEEKNPEEEQFLNEIEARVNSMMEGEGGGEVGRKAKPGSTYKRRKTVSKSTTQVGSARFLQVIQWCIDQRCRIYGLHQPEKFQIDWKTRAIQAGLSESEANEQFENMVKTWTEVLSDKDKKSDAPPEFNEPGEVDSADGYPE